MKIDKTDQTVKSVFPESSHQARQSIGKEFEKILNETLDGTQKVCAGHSQTAFVSPLSSLQPVSSSAIDRQDTVGRIGNLLDLLDRYRRMLTDPLVALKKMEPILQEMDQEKQNLAPVLESLSDADGLKEILNQTLVTAQMEITKFYRGDYVAP